jgi:DNA-binding XRE family transcriptional regulator
MITDIGDRRRQLGLSQADLARAAGLTRPLVSAVETGRHIPSVKAAIAIAGALGVTVEGLFGPEPPRPVALPAFGSPPLGAGAVTVIRVGDDLVYTSLPHWGAGDTGWSRPDGVVREGRLDLFPDADTSGLAVAGCDPALGLAASLLPARGPERLVPIHASTKDALEALRAGRVHAALVHGVPGHLPEPLEVRRWRLARWRVGLATRPGGGIELSRVGRGEVRAARREPGAESQKALERALRRAGAPRRMRGPVAAGHVDAARLVAEGAADVAITIEAAALAFGLDLQALEEHVVEIWVGAGWAGQPGAAALLEAVASPSFRLRLEALGGYDLSGAGQAA